MHIEFTLLRYKNFLSVGNAWQEIELNNTNTTLMIGANGSGKSTFLDALSFCLYGKPYRKINKPQLVNSINKKDCLVECEFIANGVEYKVRRGIKKNVFEIYEGGELKPQDGEAKDYQQYLEKSLLKMNHKSFTQNVMLGSAGYVPFMQLDAADRRLIVEDLLDIQVFSTMRAFLKDKVDDNTDNLKKTENSITLITNKIEMQKAHIAALASQSESLINGYEADLYVIEESIKKVNETIADYDKQKEELTVEYDALKVDAAEQTQQKCNQYSVKFKLDISNLEKEISFFKDHKDCPTCTQLIDDEFRKNAIDQKTKEIESLKTKLDAVKTKYDNALKVIQQGKEIQSKISDIETKLMVEYRGLKIHKESKKNIEIEIDSLKKLTGDNSKEVKQLEKYQSELAVSESLKGNLLKEKITLQACAVILKDNGIKAAVIKQYIPIMNTLINKYLSAMEFFVQFEIDENFNETIKSRYRDEFSYESFSEGQKARIDLALLFTWRDISRMRNSVSTNLLIMDEVFDGSLDSDGQDELLNIIKNLTRDCNTFVISHKTDQLLDQFERVLKFSMVKNYTQMEVL